MTKISGWIFGLLPALFFIQFRQVIFGFLLPSLQKAYEAAEDTPNPTRLVFENASAISIVLLVFAVLIVAASAWINLRSLGEKKWILLNWLQIVSYLILIQLGGGVLLALALPLFATMPK